MSAPCRSHRPRGAFAPRKLDADTLCDLVRIDGEVKRFGPDWRPSCPRDLELAESAHMDLTRTSWTKRRRREDGEDESANENARLTAEVLLSAARRDFDVYGTPVPIEIVELAKRHDVTQKTLAPSVEWYIVHCNRLLEALEEYGDGLDYAKKEISIMTIGTHETVAVENWTRWMHDASGDDELVVSNVLAALLAVLRRFRDVIAMLNAFEVDYRKFAFRWTLEPRSVKNRGPCVRFAINECIRLLKKTVASLNENEKRYDDTVEILRYVDGYINEVGASIERNERELRDVGDKAIAQAQKGSSASKPSGGAPPVFGRLTRPPAIGSAARKSNAARAVPVDVNIVRAESFFSVLYKRENIEPLTKTWILDTAETANVERIDLYAYLERWFVLWTDNHAIAFNFHHDALRFFEGDESFAVSVRRMRQPFSEIGGAFCEVLERAFRMWSTNADSTSGKSLVLSRFKYNSLCDFERLAVSVLSILKNVLMTKTDVSIAIPVWEQFAERYAKRSPFAERVMKGVETTVA